jgi:AcrR family transcriptional regulator
MNTPNNQRSQQTTKDLEEALVLLLKKKKFEDISIQDLCKKAGVNRTTFYAHYDNLSEMISSIQMNRFKDSVNFYINPKTGKFHEPDKESREKCIETLRTVAENRDISLAFFTTPCLYSLYADSVQRYWNTISEEIRKKWKYKSDANALYHLIAMHACFNAIVQHWLETGCKESPEEIVDIIGDEFSMK